MKAFEIDGNNVLFMYVEALEGKEFEIHSRKDIVKYYGAYIGLFYEAGADDAD